MEWGQGGARGVGARVAGVAGGGDWRGGNQPDRVPGQTVRRYGEAFLDVDGPGVARHAGGGAEGGQTPRDGMRPAGGQRMAFWHGDATHGGTRTGDADIRHRGGLDGWETLHTHPTADIRGRRPQGDGTQRRPPV